MKKQISDEQFDQMMRTVLSDAALNDAAVNDIADSRHMWWAVKRQIAQQKETSATPWPPSNIIRRLLTIGIPTAFAAALLISFFVFRTSNTVGTAGIIPVNNVQTAETVATDEPKTVESTVAKAENKTAVHRSVTAVPVKFTSPKRIVDRVASNATVAKVAPKTEIRTEFIALSYARNPESGQIVRVKVPSSMMVTLGLVASVEKPSNLVDAEVLVGDDGLARAIRFIR